MVVFVVVVVVVVVRNAFVCNSEYLHPCSTDGAASSSQSYSFSGVSCVPFVPSAPSVPSVPSRIRSKVLRVVVGVRFAILDFIVLVLLDVCFVAIRLVSLRVD